MALADLPHRHLSKSRALLHQLKTKARGFSFRLFNDETFGCVSINLKKIHAAN
jgi:hypothetical protein